MTCFDRFGRKMDENEVNLAWKGVKIKEGEKSTEDTRSPK